MDRVSAIQPRSVPRQPPINFYSIHKPHSSRAIKSRTTAISATLAIVFMASYRAPTPKEEAPHGGERGFLGSFGGTGDGREPIIRIQVSIRGV